jgi:class 3 adenylate cyclase
LTLFATSIGGIALIHDILRTQEILINQNQAEWLSPCLLLFVIIEAVVLLRMFYDSFTTIRDLSDELMESNEDLRETNVAIERFVPVEFLKQLNKVSIKDVHRGDHADARMNVLFADIRAFTQQIERKSSAEAFEYINAVLERMEIQIHSQGGFINQYFGDGIMALFDHNSDAAVAAAIGMQRALREHNRERAGRDAFETLMGVGINTGAVMLGTIGGEERLDSGVVGDPVNVAARIESLTRTYGAEILISGNVYERLFDPSRYQLRELDRVQLRGKSEVITIYEVLDGLDAEVLEKKLATLADFQEGRRLLAEGDRESARAAFEACLRIHPDDAAIAIYLERIEAAALV